MMILVNLTLLLNSQIQKNNQIKAKSLKATTKCFFDFAVIQNIEISWLEKICIFLPLK